MLALGSSGSFKRVFLLAVSIFALAHTANAKDIGPGDLRSWVGAYPWEAPEGQTSSFLKLPPVRAQMRALLPRQRIRQIDNLFTVSTPIENVDGYVVVYGCQPHACPNYYSAAYSLATGDAFFFFADDMVCFSKTGTLKSLPVSVKVELTNGRYSWDAERRARIDGLSCKVVGKP